MQQPFNPYNAWLGITGVGQRPNHYALLGLKLFESDPAQIAAAAERQMAKVFKVQAGPQQAHWQRMLAEVGEAKQTLGDKALKGVYDDQLRRELVAHDSPQSAVGAPAGGVNLLPPGRNVWPPKTPAHSPHDRAAQGGQFQSAPVRSASSPTREPSDAHGRPAGVTAATGPLLPPSVKTGDPPTANLPPAAAHADPMTSVPIAGTLAAPGAVGQEYADLADPMAPVEELLPPEAMVSAPTPAAQAASTAQSGEEALPLAPQVPGTRSVGYTIAMRRRHGQERLLVALLVLFVVAAAVMAAGYVTGFIRFGAPGDVARNEDGGDDVVSDVSAADNKPAERGGDATNGDTAAQDSKTRSSTEGPTGADHPPEPAAKSDGSSAPPNSNGDATDTKAKNSGKPATVSDKPPPDSAQVAKFQGTLAAARGALGRRDFAEAKGRIEEAKRLAATDEQSEMADGFESLAEYVEGFWDAVREGTEDLEQAGELTVGSTVVSIVEIGKNHLVIRAAGQNRRYPLDRLPAGLAVAIAKRWFDERAENKVFLGAFHFVDPRTDAADAKRLWQEAAAAGLDVKPLLLLLPIAELKATTAESDEP